MRRLYLVRHGQTEFNVRRAVQGQCDSPLTPLGRAQAHDAALWLSNHGVVPDRMVSSPLGRAMSTAAIIACGLGFDGNVEAEPGIIERAYGSFEGGPFDELPCDVWNPGDALVPFGGEGDETVRDRMTRALASDICADGVSTLLAVSHGSASRQFVATTLAPGETVPERLPNCAVMAFSFDESARSFSLEGIFDPARGRVCT